MKKNTLTEAKILKIKELKEQGDLHSSNNDFYKAISSYDEALSIDKNNQNILYNKGMCQYDVGDCDGAMISFEKIIDLNPTDDGSIRWLAKIHFANGNNDLALESYLKALEINKSVFYWTEIAQVYLKLGNPNEALNSYLIAEKLEPAAFIYFNIGTLYYENRFSNYNEDYLGLAIKNLELAVKIEGKCDNSKLYKKLLKTVKAKHKEINQDNS